MAWSAKQKQIAIRACRQAGLDDSARKLILRQFRNAMFDACGVPASEPSSTSGRLTNADFERFMAIVEDRAGGRLGGWSPNYWQEKAGSRSEVVNERMAWKIRELYREFEAQPAGGLEGHGIYGLEGLVSRFTAHRTRQLEEMTPREAWNLIEMLKSVMSRRGELQPAKEAERQERLFSDAETPRFTTVSVQEPPKRRRKTHTKPLEDADIPF